MVRIFSIYFSHEDILHSAIVSVRTTPVLTEYHLGNLDEGLRVLLPGDKIISQTPKNLFFQNTSPENSTSLMKAIIKSITNHLHADNDVISEV